MVIDQDTLQPLHQLSEEGKVAYQKFLKASSEYKQAHPFLWILDKLVGKIGVNIIDLFG